MPCDVDFEFCINIHFESGLLKEVIGFLDICLYLYPFLSTLLVSGHSFQTFKFGFFQIVIVNNMIR